MEKILRAFASGQLQVVQVTESRSPEREMLLEKSFKLHKELEQKLGEVERELLEHMLEAILGENCRNAEDKFIRGYRLGTLMMMEVFAEQDTF